MHISAHVARFCRYLLVLVVFFGVGLLVNTMFVTKTHAQVTATATTETSPNNFHKPDVDANVPQDSHSYAQIVMIDVLSAFICELSGIDPLPKHQCIGYNASSGKYGLVPVASQSLADANKPKVGGFLGFMAGQIGFLYQPTVSTSTYFDYLSHNFGIVPHAYAQGTQLTNCTNTSNASFGYGYCGLSPIFNLWKLTRDFAYSLLVIAFVILGLGIMLRFRADPKTIMTLQNQIPRVVIAIILITFSYAIAGFMIDLMWTVTYMGINTITAGAGNTICADDGKTTVPVGVVAPINLLETPLVFVNRINRTCGTLHTGIGGIAWATGSAVSTTITDLVVSFLGYDTLHCGIGLFGFGNGSIVDCFTEGFIDLIKLIATLFVIFILIITLVRVWFELLKTAVLLIIYTIGGPIWIVFGLIPGRPLGFEKWLRLMFAHLAAFPLVAFTFVFAKILADTYPDAAKGQFDPNNIFVPPLIGNPHGEGLGALLAFGLILISPTIPNMIKTRMNVPPGKMGSAIRGGIASGASVPGSIARGTVGRYFRRADPMTGEGAGVMRDFLVGRMVNKKTGNLKLPFRMFGRFAYGASDNKKPTSRSSRGH